MTTRSLRSCGKIFVLLVSKTPPDANEGCRLLDYADRANHVPPDCSQIDSSV
jgi:hypothetical protein